MNQILVRHVMCGNFSDFFLKKPSTGELKSATFGLAEQKQIVQHCRQQKAGYFAPTHAQKHSLWFSPVTCNKYKNPN